MSRRPMPLGARGAILLSIAVAGIAAAWWLDLRPSDLALNEKRLGTMRDFLHGAITPAMQYETDAHTNTPFLLDVAQSVFETIRFAAAAIGLSVLLAIPLTFAGSSAWRPNFASTETFKNHRIRRCFYQLTHTSARTLMAAMRSVHELLWAILFLAAVGATPLSMIVAIAIPYAGTLAKVYSEFIDEAPRNASAALTGSGASAVQTFCFGLIPRARSDMLSYTLYRFECALRSSAVLSFFGTQGLGLRIHQAFQSGHYHEVWTYLYALVALVAITDWWCGAVRKGLNR